MKKPRLMTPGPAPVPEDVLLELARPVIHHRSAEAKQVIVEAVAGLKEVFLQADGRSARTFPARYPMLQLDRIYVRNAKAHTPLILPRRPWSHLSDHAPLAAEIRL